MPSFPETARRILQDWLDHHFAYPYPNQQEKESLSRSTGLTVQQVSTWYANHRRRLRQKGLLNTKMTHGCISSGPTKRQASQQSYGECGAVSFIHFILNDIHIYIRASDEIVTHGTIHRRFTINTTNERLRIWNLQ
ncbi:hypothetical protein CAPTEDRAFT_100741 [Capitella teleta]|uniref:Homeobox domain-containing protein n=1 Tax=Capitella teleta TaxID=283909 RepID=R7UUB9_CAPTE|nr:hypothetical protein CAPTEDRAFT_100741 [Capitella teleta]|eukprot:ELU09790.1 hypothetical protein CAPTEDRAFT_100741 [Capitella teleta]